MKKIYVYLILLILLPSLVNAKSGKELATFNACVDGDTAKFNINGEVKTVRFLAIDTPETVKPNTAVQPYGKQASEYTCSAITNAKEIYVEYDPNADNDKYGRELVWVWVDGSLLNDDLVKLGLAKVAYLYDDYTYTSKLQDDEIIAKASKINLWSDTTEESTDTSNTKENNGMDIAITVIWIVIIILFCIFNKSFRKKAINKVKRKSSSELKKLLK